MDFTSLITEQRPSATIVRAGRSPKIKSTYVNLPPMTHTFNTIPSSYPLTKTENVLFKNRTFQTSSHTQLQKVPSNSTSTFTVSPVCTSKIYSAKPMLESNVRDLNDTHFTRASSHRSRSAFCPPDCSRIPVISSDNQNLYNTRLKKSSLRSASTFAGHRGCLKLLILLLAVCSRFLPVRASKITKSHQKQVDSEQQLLDQELCPKDNNQNATSASLMLANKGLCQAQITTDPATGLCQLRYCMKPCAFYRAEEKQLAGGRPLLSCIDRQLQCKQHEEDRENEKARILNQTTTREKQKHQNVPNAHDPTRLTNVTSTQRMTTTEKVTYGTKRYESDASTATFGMAQVYLATKILLLAATIFSFSLCAKVFVKSQKSMSGRVNKHFETEISEYDT